MSFGAGKPLPDEPWPLSARSLLSKREQLFYQSLLGVYPDHKIFVQVALSQLINVDRNHPERDSIRARYKQLVADFVLCRPDLGLVAVIELDDRTHEWPKRKAADARKNKALTDAGIRLVRVPAGRLPSEDTLRALIGADGPAQEGPPEETVLSLAEPVDTYSAESVFAWRDDSSAESRELNRIALKAIFGGAVLVGGWFVYSQLLPTVIQQAFQPLAVPRVRAAPVTRASIPVAPPLNPTAPVISGPSAEELAWQKRVQVQAANALQKKKDHAWAAFYSAPAACEHPVDWTAQVECGNQYMRAKKRFEEQWATRQGTAAELVLGNGSGAGSPK